MELGLILNLVWAFKIWTCPRHPGPGCPCLSRGLDQMDPEVPFHINYSMSLWNPAVLKGVRGLCFSLSLLINSTCVELVLHMGYDLGAQLCWLDKEVPCVWKQGVACSWQLPLVPPSLKDSEGFAAIIFPYGSSSYYELKTEKVMLASSWEWLCQFN